MHAEVEALAAENAWRFASDPLVMANTEVNSGNFIVDGERMFLVDWEKAVTSSRYQDLGHFLVPTTTLWKTERVLTEDEKLAFLEEYVRASGPHVYKDTSLDEVRLMTRLLERTILLRGLSWCFMAYYEYTRTERALANEDTFAKIKSYLDQGEWLYALTN